MKCIGCHLSNHPHTNYVTNSGRCLCCNLIVDWSGFAPRICYEYSIYYANLFARCLNPSHISRRGI